MRTSLIIAISKKDDETTIHRGKSSFASLTIRRFRRDLTVKNKVTLIFNYLQMIRMTRSLCANVIIATKSIILRETVLNRRRILKLMQLNRTLVQVFKSTLDKRFLLNSSSTMIKNRKTRWTHEYCSYYRELKKQSNVFVSEAVCAHRNSMTKKNRLVEWSCTVELYFRIFRVVVTLGKSKSIACESQNFRHEIHLFHKSLFCENKNSRWRR